MCHVNVTVLQQESGQNFCHMLYLSLSLYCISFMPLYFIQSHTKVKLLKQHIRIKVHDILVPSAKKNMIYNKIKITFGKLPFRAVFTR